MVSSSRTDDSPGWTVRGYEHESGAQITGFDPSTGMALSIQPLFKDDARPPDMVIVGNYFHWVCCRGDRQLEEQNGICRAEEIGAAYSLCLNHQIKDNLEMFEFSITEL